MPESPSEPPRPTGLMAGVITYYRVSILAVVALLIAGVAAFVTMPRSEDPEFDTALGQVITLWPGVAARQVEDLVTRPLEEAVQGTKGVKLLESESSAGLSVISVKMSAGAVPSEVLDDVKARVKEVQRRLPAGVNEPLTIRRNTAMIPVALLSLSGGDDYAVLEQWAEHVEEEIEALDQISDVEIEALPERQIQVRADPQRLAQYRIPITRLHEAQATAPSRLLTATLDDAMAVDERPNMPATTYEWPNWSIALPQPIEKLKDSPIARGIARALRRRSRRR